MGSTSHGLAALEAHAEEVASAVPLGQALDSTRFGPYRGYGELVALMLEAASRPGCDAVLGGYSAGGSPIVGLVAGDSEARALSVVLGGIHAMEWIGVEVALGLLESLTAEPPAGRRVLLLPIVNVDGYRAVEASLRARRRRYHRANRRGVDLNRNWPTYWRPRLVSRLFPWLGTSGPHPGSEPELRAVLSMLEDEVALGHRIDLALSLHSVGRAVLYPYGGRFRAPPEVGVHREAGRAVARALPERYRVSQVSRWFPGAFAHGMEIDHLHRHYGATALLVECSGGGLRLADPSSWFQPFRWYNPPDLPRVRAELAGALDPFVRGELAG